MKELTLLPSFWYQYMGVFAPMVQLPGLATDASDSLASVPQLCKKLIRLS